MNTTTDYTPNRHTALELVNSNKIWAVDGILKHRDGRRLEPGVTASLLALLIESHIDQHLTQLKTENHKQWPVRLTVPGTNLLARFRDEHPEQQATLGGWS